MRHVKRHRSLLRLLGSSIACCVLVQAAAAPVPTALQGHWEVVQVAVDHRDQPHWQYFPDDPRLLGRQLDVDDAGIRLDDGSHPCADPAVTALPVVKLQRFIGERLARPESFDTPVQPTLADFGIRPDNASVSPLEVHCTPDSSPWNGAWLVATSDDRLLTNYDGSGYVLVLRKVEGRQPVRASFACAKAKRPAEQTLCASATLAAYDRSVAAAYRFALERAGDDAPALRQAQRQWVASRDACGTDAQCLADSMRDRTEELMQQ